ncbi:MAG TPA: alpha/beta fold hydrolase [Candidatus Nitrosocosmicus sp.]|nr:alpha/beta fold hydrolase [Candidatus Nitrosocosmicus sp.]
MLTSSKKIKIAEFTGIIIFAIVIMTGAVLFSYPVYGQGANNSGNSTTATTSTNDSEPLPVLLIHGYMADASMWKKWEDLLKKDNIPVFPITFRQSDDKCGSAAEHAKELSSQIGDIKDQTGQDKVNIVGHSKGGLDARVYLANNTQDIANLIMIGTPNAGSPLAENNEMCAPAVYDLRPGSPSTVVEQNQNTNYYTIAGDWKPESGNCDLSMFSLTQKGGYDMLPKPNDGMVPLSSVESLNYTESLGHSSSCHSNLLSEYEYGLAKEILAGGK